MIQEYFTKIKLDLSTVKFDIRDLGMVYDHPTLGGSVVHYNMNKQQCQEVMDLLPPELRPIVRTIRVAWVRGIVVLPHTDGRQLLCINYYTTPNDCTTWFWKKKPEFPDLIDKPPSYNFDEIEPVCSFNAEQNSCYLFQNERIHSVHMNQRIMDRQFIQVTFCNDSTYNGVANQLQQLGLIAD